jgi:hypothetical protein
MRPKPILSLLLTALLIAACSPLRQTQRNQKRDSTTLDRSEIRKVVHDILRESGTLSQTVVEFYPPTNTLSFAPQVVPPATDSGAALPQVADIVETPKTPAPSVKRIIHTEIASEREQQTTTDSMAHNNIHTEVQSELSDKVVEKPPAATSTLKWIAIALVAIAAIILLIKLPKIKLP